MTTARNEAIEKGRDDISQKLDDLLEIIADAEKKQNFDLVNALGAIYDRMHEVGVRLDYLNTAEEVNEQVREVMLVSAKEIASVVSDDQRKQQQMMQEAKDAAEQKVNKILEEIKDLEKQRAELPEPGQSQSGELKNDLVKLREEYEGYQQQITDDKTLDDLIDLQMKMNHFLSVESTQIPRELDRLIQLPQQIAFEKAVSDLQSSVDNLNVVMQDAQKKSYEIYSPLQKLYQQATAKLENPKIKDMQAINDMIGKVEKSVDIAQQALKKSAEKPQEKPTSQIVSKDQKEKQSADQTRERIRIIDEFLTDHKDKMKERKFLSLEKDFPSGVKQLIAVFDNLKKGQNGSVVDILAKKSDKSVNEFWVQIRGAVEANQKSKNKDVRTLVNAVRNNDYQKLEQPKQERRVMNLPS